MIGKTNSLISGVSNSSGSSIKVSDILEDGYIDVSNKTQSEVYSFISQNENNMVVVVDNFRNGFYFGMLGRVSGQVTWGSGGDSDLMMGYDLNTQSYQTYRLQITYPICIRVEDYNGDVNSVIRPYDYEIFSASETSNAICTIRRCRKIWLGIPKQLIKD